MTALLDLSEVRVTYRPRRPLLSRLAGAFSRGAPEPPPAVADASLEIAAGETVALVGESGSGKTTLARAVAGLVRPQQGRIVFDGADITAPVQRRSREQLRHIQYVFQNPMSSLNPRRRVGYNLGRVLEVFFNLSRAERRGRMRELLAGVHLDPGYVGRFPHQLSGGEAQRVAIAQALAAEPKLILCDEVLSALDVSVQDNILDLLRELQSERGVAYLFIAHDLAVVRWLAHRVVVLYQGRVVETGTVEEIFSPPHHPYTALLLASIPGRGAAQGPAAGEDAATAASAPVTAGCPFAPRCPHRIDPVCAEQDPPLRPDSPTHSVRCHLSTDERARVQVQPRSRAVAEPSEEAR